PALQGVVLGCEPNAVGITVSPREGLDRVLRVPRVEPRSQDGAVADTEVRRSSEGPDGVSAVVSAKGRVPACLDPTSGVEEIVAEDDVLTRDIRLVHAAAVVATDHTRVGRRPLGPVDPATLESDLLGRVIAGRQAGDERADAPIRIHDHDA